MDKEAEQVWLGMLYSSLVTNIVQHIFPVNSLLVHASVTCVAAPKAPVVAKTVTAKQVLHRLNYLDSLGPE